ncbi:MAG: sigma-70 family RNA polymerase sigma factor [Clostridiales bacterium]|jgi:RNA polymerase sigma-70 factor (ECF subfamily)|nr:sigma-70 family RNA polymerase sigma factor [Clostridiales bacterium]MDR2712138.1 sigma-70 family RNA polymerase sigma factor [Clostridiales bacterium]
MNDNSFDVDAVLLAYSDTVYKIALARTGNRNDADDIFQEVFLRLVKHINKISSEEHMKSWLIRVTINCCKNHFRSWRNNTVSLSDLNAELTVDFTPEESGIYQAVLRLPAKYRDVVHLFYYEELPIKEISEILKRKESTVKSQLSRGREKLKSILEEDIADENKNR